MNNMIKFKKTSKVIGFLLLLILALSGCFNKSEEKLSKEEIMAKNFKTMIKEYQVKIAKDNIKRGDSESTILDGIYVENELKLEFYDMTYVGTLVDADINLLASKLYIASSNSKKAYIVVSNRGLEYQKMLEYTGVSNFLDDTKSCDILSIINIDAMIWSISESEFKKANGEELTARINTFSIDTIGNGIVDEGNKKIYLSYENSMDLTNLIASFSISDEAIIKVGDVAQKSGETVNNFTTGVSYTIIGKNGEEVIYTVTLEKNELGLTHPESGEYSVIDQSTWETSDWNLGANYVGTDLTFAVYSKNATKVLLEIYEDKTTTNATYDYWMTKGIDDIWRAKIIKSIPKGTFYGFRVWGANWTYDKNWKRGNSAVGFVMDVDENGNRFNPNKVLYDPYARELSHDKETPEMVTAGENGAMYGTGGLDDVISHGYSGTMTGNVEIDRRNVDTGKWCSKSIVLQDSTSFGTKPELLQKDSIIYEAHPRGLTKSSSAVNLATILNGIEGFENVESVPDQYRGTYKGASYMAKYLKALGYNTIELLPVQETANDINPDDNPGGNYWGYMTYGYFAPDRRYSYDQTPGGPTSEFKEMVKAFHDEGLEVYLDVVYNHTGEGGTWDDTGKCKEITSFAGFDNSEYYSLVSTNKSEYWQTTGCGNNLQCDNTMVQNLITDSLKYWINEMGVDGFRFDLAPVLGRISDGTSWNFDSSAKLLKDIADMTDTYNVEMIAEAWDIGGAFVGGFPDKWGEWNGNYRDAMRSFMKGAGNTSAFNNMLNGDYDGFNDQGGPQKSINFIVAHDGFTLTDLVSYNDKNNGEVWPFGPSDGGNDNNDSWGSDGDQDLRRQRLRNFWAIQFLSRGVPMSVWGDEFGRSQNGNNNPYNIDSIATWSDYNMINTDSPTTIVAGQHDNLGTDKKDDDINNIFLFAKYMANLRKNHEALRQADYSVNYEFKKEDGSTDPSDGDKCIRVRIDGSSVGDNDFLVMINMYSEDVNFTLADADLGNEWARIIDTALWTESDSNTWEIENAFRVASNGVYGAKAWSVVVFEEVEEIAKVITPEISGDYYGVYIADTSVTMSCATTDSVIYYTLDGSEPTTGSAIYETSLTLTADGGNTIGGYEIKAIAVKNGMANSEITEKRFAVTTPIVKPTYGSDVMLQGFGWESEDVESQDSESWYEVISNNKDDIKNHFEWIWLPPASTSPSFAPQGYMPKELNNIESYYGTEVQLKQAIIDISPTKAIADIVINHRASNSDDLTDFQNPIWGSDAISGNDITNTVTGTGTGWNDTGVDYEPATDIDHTNIKVQKDIVDWMNYLKSDIGFVGWRYDYVKGYAGEYVGYYNSKTNPEFSVGELWEDDSSQTGLDDWVMATKNGGGESMVFDFSLKNTLNNAFGWYKIDGETHTDYWDMSLLKRGDEDKPEGYIGWKPENAITFVDNHDTGSTQGHWKLNDANVYLAYTFILTHSGIPTVFWEHYFDSASYTDQFGEYNGTEINTLKEHIDTLIKIRKDNGINQKSDVVVEKAVTNEYAAKIDDKIAIKIGDGATYNPGSTWGEIYSGTNFCIWKKGNIAKLSNIEISNGTLAPVFNSEIEAYNTDVSYFIENITITPTSIDPDATITVSGIVVSSGAVSENIALSVGENVITVVAISADNQKSETYTVTVNRLVLSAQVVADSITEVQAPAQEDTVLTMPIVPDGYSIAITSSSSIGVIKLDGTIVPPTNVTTVSLVFTITKIDDSSTADTVTIDVIISPDTIAPTFAGLTTATNNLADKITLTWSEANDTKSLAENIKYNIYWSTGTGTQEFTTANKVVTGGITVDLTVIDGLNLSTDYYFVVRAEDETGNEETNVVEITGIMLSSDSNLSDLIVNGETINSFDSTTTSYAITVANNVTALTVSAIATTGAGIEITGETGLIVGDTNTIEVEVTAEDGTTTEIYTITVTRSDTITFHYAIPSWGTADTAKINSYIAGTWTGSDIAMILNGSWYEATVNVISGTSQIGFKLEFSEGLKVKHLNITTEAAITYVTFTPESNNIWIDSRNIVDWGTEDFSEGGGVTHNNYSLTAEKSTSSEVDITVPEFSTEASMDNVTETTLDITGTLNENGKIYYVVLADGADAPSVSQVKAGTDSTDGAALKLGSADDIGSGVVMMVTGLTASTVYDIYVVAEDTSLNVQSSVIKLEVTTPDTTAPSFTVAPGISNSSAEGFDITGTLNENGKIYYVVLVDGAISPSVIQVKAGTDSTDGAALKSGSENETGSGIVMSVTGLTALTAYDIYVVAEDDEVTANVQSSVTKLEITTASGADTTVPTFAGLTTATNNLADKTTLTWSEASDNESTPGNIKYNIYWSTGTGTQEFTTANKVVTGVTTVDLTATDGLNLSADYYFVVRAEDETGNEETNVVETTGRMLSSDSILSALTVSTGKLSPVFASETIFYAVILGNDITSVTLTGIVNDANSSLTIAGLSVTSGVASQELSLNIGDNSIDVLVTAEDGTTKTYTVLFKRADTITFHYAIPSWGAADTAKINSYTAGTWTGSDITMTGNGSWYEATLNVISGTSEIGFKLEFTDGTTGKYLTADTEWTDVTYTSATKNIWIDSRTPDNWGELGTINNYSLNVEKYKLAEIDITAPEFSTEASMDNVTETTLDITGTLNENGKIYYVVLADGATAPSVIQVKSGTDSTDGAALKSGSADDIGSGVVMSVTGLTALIAYDIYVVAEDDEVTANVQSSVTKLEVTTPDTTAPSFTVAPGISNSSAEGFDITGTLNENGKIYYVVLADGATAPSVIQVKAGTDITDTTALKSGLADDMGSGVVMSLTGLTVSTAYDIYVVAEDDETIANVQVSVTKLDTTTSDTVDTTAPTFNIAPAASNMTSTSLDIKATLNENGKIYYVVLADGATAPSVIQVKAGTDSTDGSALKSGSADDIGSGVVMPVTSLTASTGYDIYVVAEDDETTANVQSSVTKLDITTSAMTKVATPIITSVLFGNTGHGVTFDNQTGDGTNQPEERKVIVSCDTSEAIIEYTSDDWSTTNTYSGEFWILETTTLKIRAKKADMITSDEIEVTYKKTTLKITWNVGDGNSVTFRGGSSPLQWSNDSAGKANWTENNVWQWITWEYTSNFDSEAWITDSDTNYGGSYTSDLISGETSSLN